MNDPMPGHNRYRGMISMPYLDKDGKPVSMRFRCPHDHNCKDFGHPKYMSMTDEPVRLFNIGSIHRAKGEIHLAEGEFDAMLLNKLGLPAVAVAGVQAWQPHHRIMLAGFSRVWVWGDPDDSGADFNRRVTQQMRQAKAVRLRDGDVTDTWRAGGASAVLSLIERSAA